MGNIPDESGFIKRFRRHQGWWRAFVLNEPEGMYWDEKNKQCARVCNRINNGDIQPESKNFLNKEIAREVEIALEQQKKTGSGIMDKDRLYNNLLSSQPLAFNFFGFFNANRSLALDFLHTILPDIIDYEVVFEYAPKSVDNSAFDFGFLVKTETKKGFIGFECKYTDTFSAKRPKSNIYYGDTGDKNYENYYRIYQENRYRFPDDYFSYVRNSGYNQLFRNELLAMQINPKPDFVITGLLCHHDDKKTIEAGIQFQKKIGNSSNDFILMTYADYFERIQKLELTWEQRELVMMLWARYCGLNLSLPAFKSK